MRERTRHWIVLSVLLLMAASSAWLATSVVIGRMIVAELEAKQQAQPRATGLVVLQLDHHAGWLSSSGSAELRLATGCGSLANQLAPTFHIDYQIDHWPAWSAPVRARLQARPLHILGYDVRALVGNQTLLHGTVTRHYNGSLLAQFHSLPLTRQTASGSLSVAASRGRVWLRDDRALELSWLLPEFRAETRGSRTWLRGVALQWKLDDRHLATGKTWLGVTHAHVDQARAERVSLATQGTRQADRVHWRVLASAAQLEFEALPLHDAFAQLEATGLDSDSLETLLELARSNCSLIALSPHDGASARAALRRLGDAGLSIGVRELAARSGDGSLRGDLSLELTPVTPARKLSLLGRTRALGKLKLDGQALRDYVHRSHGLQRFFSDDASGVQASFSFEQRTLQINGRPWNPLFMQIGLALFESAISGP